MKKTLIKNITIVILLFVLVTGSLFLNGRDRAYAAVEKTVALKDDFNRDTLGDDWINNGAKLDKDYDALRFNGDYDYGGAISPAAYKLSGSCEIRFVVKVFSGSWFAMGFGGRESLTAYAGYSFAVSFETRATTVSQGNGAFTLTAVQKSEDAYFMGYAKTTPVEVVISLEEISEIPHLFNISVAYYDSITGAELGGMICSEPLTELGNNEFICFNTGNAVADILEFEITEEGERVFYDDFTSPSIAYGGYNGNTNWSTNANYDKDSVYIAPISALDLSSPDAFVIYNDRMPGSNNYVEKTYEVTFSVDIGSRGFSEAVLFGVGFDLSPQSTRADESKMIGFVLYEGMIRPAMLVGGGIIRFTSGEGFNPSDLYGRTHTFSMSANSDGSVWVNFAGKQFTFKNVNTSGYMAIGCQNVSDIRTNQVQIDDIQVVVYGSQVSDAGDMSSDFTGVKVTVDDDGNEYKDYYLNEMDWYLGTNVKLLMYIERDPVDYLSFTRCTNYSAFGPKQKYSEYIIQCDVTVTSTAENNQMVGLSFGRTAYSMTTQYTTAVGFYMQKQGEIERTILYTYNCKFEGGSNDKVLYKEDGSEEYMWATREDKKLITQRYNLMFVVKNRSVTVHYKRAEEDVSVLSKVRAKVVDVNTYGYPAIFGLGGMSMEVRNFRIINIDPLAGC